jgi:ABC-type branched-subunit amino acid transport system ATPase component
MTIPTSLTGPEATAPEPILRIAELAAGYGQSVVIRGATVDIPADGLTVVIGPNGAGKSTLLKAVFGLAEVFRGRVTFRGRDAQRELVGVPAHEMTRLGLAMVPQLNDVFAGMTVLENLLVGGTSARKVRAQRIEETLERVPLLKERARQRAGTLSGGQRKQLAVARALMTDPTLLVMDEPTAGMAPLVVEELYALLKRLTDSGTAVLMVEQNASRALRAADHAIVLDSGRVRLVGSGSELLADPHVVDLYLGAIRS